MKLKLIFFGYKYYIHLRVNFYIRKLKVIMTKFKLDVKKSFLELFMIFLAITISFFIEEWRQDNQLKKRLIEDYNAM